MIVKTGQSLRAISALYGKLTIGKDYEVVIQDEYTTYFVDNYGQKLGILTSWIEKYFKI